MDVCAVAQVEFERVAMANLTDDAAAYFMGLQDRICAGLEAAEGKDGARFIEDPWQRAGGGGGRTRVMSGGKVFEKAGVNFSDVHGELDPSFAGGMPGSGLKFRATGISLVLHPENPHIPTVHANFRRIEHGDAQWFGGGADLTPYYLVDEDAHHFHRTLKTACERHDPVLYTRFKKWCDRYFFIKHRNEPRGVGGMFFDYLGIGAESRSKDFGAEPPSVVTSAVEADSLAQFAFVRELGDAFLNAYLPIVERRRHSSYTAQERNWQLHRRGRYVEFNLVYDRGTIFGLKTGGRIESILMSLPACALWTYDHAPEPRSPEERTLKAICSERNWGD